MRRRGSVLNARTSSRDHNVRSWWILWTMTITGASLAATSALRSMPKSRKFPGCCEHQGTKCLWIDSLCILQESEEHFHREAKSMGHIYQVRRRRFQYCCIQLG
ncbi:hypothetical protein F5Y06DRAFT_267638 [Hypoxylon sp. FL0890]|nr:hypothetical protein F5Y06DRAFT_267638 [Hypoxylon sp. FL0890]